MALFAKDLPEQQGNWLNAFIAGQLLTNHRLRTSFDSSDAIARASIITLRRHVWLRSSSLPPETRAHMEGDGLFSTNMNEVLEKMKINNYIDRGLSKRRFEAPIFGYNKQQNTALSSSLYSHRCYYQHPQLSAQQQQRKTFKLHWYSKQTTPCLLCQALDSRLDIRLESCRPILTGHSPQLEIDFVNSLITEALSPQTSELGRRDYSTQFNTMLPTNPALLSLFRDTPLQQPTRKRGLLSLGRRGPIGSSKWIHRKGNLFQILSDSEEG